MVLQCGLQCPCKREVEGDGTETGEGSAILEAESGGAQP